MNLQNVSILASAARFSSKTRLQVVLMYFVNRRRQGCVIYFLIGPRELYILALYYRTFHVMLPTRVGTPKVQNSAFG